MSEINRYNHWQLNSDGDNILWLYCDKADSSTNVLDKEVLAELEQIIEGLMGDTAYKGLIIASKKSDFIAGADIKLFTHLRKHADAFEFMRDVQKLYDKIENLNIPTVALIKGHCLGGGLELALACDYRVVCESEKKTLGFPEVLLGIFPAWGGTVRSTRLAGLSKSLPLILQGSLLRPDQMHRLGLVDVVQPERHLRTAARACVLGAAPLKRKKHHFSNTFLAKRVIAYKARKFLADKNVLPQHYPAPYAAIGFLSRTAIKSQRAFIEEAHAVAALTESNTTENLVRLFFLQDRLKKSTKTAADKIQHVHVIGAGTMGADIAAWCAKKGIMVSLQDQEPKCVAKALKRIYKGFKKRVKDYRQLQAIMDRIVPDVDGRGLIGADLILEAAIEDLAVKQAIFKAAEAKAKPTAIFASNTSSIPIEAIAGVLRSPGRLIGLHFFNPVAKMQLVELIQHADNDEVIINQALGFVGQLGKLPVPMKSGPGFLVNRVLMPYLMQAFKLYEEGVAPTAIDKLAVDFGMPMGPVTLADLVGLDVCLHIVEMTGDQLGLVAPEGLKKMVAENKLGVKTGEGFYQYKNGNVKKPRTPTSVKDQAMLTDRLILVMLNAVVACLREGVVADGDLADAAMVFGAGFAPFRGGPIQYAKTRGADNIQQTLQQINHHYGDQIEIDAGWSEL